ncbi:MAG: bifunctional phosphoglucose/phosphomannose isomerase [Chloroflexi bacterium RBG_16_57_11]|nr:MAG: bifunctional phosphoglucose/phosphomannose isomerase [Chloroflexi bacterium RBG_16_57_11]
MLAEIDALPEQLGKAWELGRQHDLPQWSDVQNVVICGLGGSAIGADLLAAYALERCRVPIIVHRDYDLPAWADGPRTLVIASSHSGNTEETLSSLAAAQSRGCRCLAITTGGKLAEASIKTGSPVWRFEHRGQPRAAVGYSFGLLLSVLARLGLLPDASEDLESAIRAMHAQQESLRASVPAVKNQSKRIAGQLVGRWVVVIGSGLLAPVARRWKCQINELAKAVGQFDVLPEADHNTLAGVLNPEATLGQSMILFLRGSFEHPRNRLRSDLTRHAMMIEGLNTDFIDARGDTPLAQQWTCLHYGDYVGYYLAMAYGVDPAPVEAIQEFKRALQEAGQG